MRSRSRPSLSRRIRSVELSATIAMAQRAGALRRAGQEILDFSVGEPDQPTPTHVIRTAERAMRAGHTKYTPTAGVPELREAVAMRYRQDFGARFEPSQGCDLQRRGSRRSTTRTNASSIPGDEVIIPTPCWPTFVEGARLAGARPVLLETRERYGFRLTARAVEKAVGPRTRALLLNTPSNPTGAVVGNAQLLEIARRRAASRHHVALRRHVRPAPTRRPPYADWPAPEAPGRPAGGAGHGVQELLHDRLADRLAARQPVPRRGHRRAELPQHAASEQLRPAGRRGRAHRLAEERGVSRARVSRSGGS